MRELDAATLAITPSIKGVTTEQVTGGASHVAVGELTAAARSAFPPALAGMAGGAEPDGMHPLELLGPAPALLGGGIAMGPPPVAPAPPVSSSLPSSDTGQSEPCRSCVPRPFVRCIRLHMESCPSTNKSQFFYGGLGLILSTGVLDCAMVLYMVVGHTKFGPDLVARALAGRYKSSDVFSHGQLNEVFKPFGTVGAYGGDMLQTWKKRTQTLFSPINHIMSYRCFLLLADDGEVNLSAPETPPPTFELFPNRGPLVRDGVLLAECTKDAARGLRYRVLPALRGPPKRGTGGCHNGAGARARADAAVGRGQVFHLG